MFQLPTHHFFLTQVNQSHLLKNLILDKKRANVQKEKTTKEFTEE